MTCQSSTLQCCKGDSDKSFAATALEALLLIKFSAMAVAACSRVADAVASANDAWDSCERSSILLCGWDYMGIVRERPRF